MTRRTLIIQWFSQRKIRFMPVVLAALVIGIIVPLQISVLIINAANSHRPIIGLKLSQQTVGWADGVKLKRYVSSAVKAQGDRLVAVVAGNYSAKASLRQLGANYDINSTNKSLLRAGRTGSWWRRLTYQDEALFGHRSMTTTFSIDDRSARAYLATVDHKITAAPTNAYFELRDGKIAVHPDKTGVSVNMKDSLSAIHATAQKSQQVVLPITQSPAPITATTLEPLTTEVQNIASKPLVITAGNASLTLLPQQLVELIEPKTVTTGAGKTEISLSFNEQKLNATVDTLLKQAESPAKPRVVIRGRLIDPGQAGLQAEGDHPKVQVLAALLKRESGVASPDSVALPMNKIDPPVVPLVTKANPSVSSPPASKTAYLTIDDGPGLYTDALLDILKRYNVHATFYLIGRNVDRYPQTAVRISSEGHILGNHSYTHSDLSRITYAAVVKELTDTQTSIKKASGVTPKAFRPPYGAQNAQVVKAATDLGLADNLWSIDPRDWAKPGAAVITQRVLSGLHPGAVVLLHVLNQQTVDSLPAIIEGIRAQGYTLN